MQIFRYNKYKNWKSFKQLKTKKIDIETQREKIVGKKIILYIFFLNFAPTKFILLLVQHCHFFFQTRFKLVYTRFTLVINSLYTRFKLAASSPSLLTASRDQNFAPLILRFLPWLIRTLFECSRNYSWFRVPRNT